MVTGLGVAIAFAAAAAWAGFDAARKELVSGFDPISAAAWVNLAQGPIFLAWALATSELAASAEYAPVGGAVLGLQVLANILLFRALSISQLSAVVPMLALTPVFSSFVGMLVLDQHLDALQWVGVVVVVGSAIGMHADSLRSDAGVWMAVGVAAIWSITTTLDKLALDHASVPVHAAVQAGGSGLVLVIGLRVRDSLQVPRMKHAKAFGGALALGTTALAFQLWAIQLLFVGLVETIKRAVGLVSAVALGRAFFDEPITPRSIAGVAGLIGGTALLLLG